MNLKSFIDILFVSNNFPLERMTEIFEFTLLLHDFFESHVI